MRRRVDRGQLAEFILRLAPCTIGMEACSSAHYWAHQFLQRGNVVKLISPQFVKPFVKGNKTDGNDAEAICEALQRPSMRFLPVKSVEQQDVQSLHRARSRLVSNRTGLMSQMGVVALILPAAVTFTRNSRSDVSVNNSASCVDSRSLRARTCARTRAGRRSRRRNTVSETGRHTMPA